MMTGLATLARLAQWRGDWDGDHMDDGWWVVMGVGMLILLVVLIAGVVVLARGGLGAQGAAPRETPIEILRRRLAAGEISPEEYERRRAVLEGAPTETSEPRAGSSDAEPGAGA